MRRIVAVLLLLLACDAMPPQTEQQAGEQPPPEDQVSPPEDPPPAPTPPPPSVPISCDSICVTFTSESFCDSDCDGWFDSVEVELGFDPCDPFSPAFCPDPGNEADICYVCRFPSSLPPPPPANLPINGASIFADDGTFWGIIDTNSFNSNSVANSFGTYGNPFSSLSIWNEFSAYGSSFNSLSPWNSFSSSPPVIADSNGFIAYLTANISLAPRVHPNDLAIAVGRPEQVRP